MSFDTVTEYLTEVWLGDLVDGSMGARPWRLHRWIVLTVIRLCAVVLVFGTPWALSLPEEKRCLWIAATGVLAVLSAALSHRSWRMRGWSCVVFAVYLAVACPFVQGADHHTSHWIPLVGTLLTAAVLSALLAARPSPESRKELVSSQYMDETKARGSRENHS